MTLTSDFRDNPTLFLDKHVVIVPGALDKLVATPRRADFRLIDGSERNAVWLDLSSDPKDSLNAYYLPWKSGHATTCDLGGEADFFFTSHLTGCRFSVFDGGVPSKTPKVSHAAGDITTPALRTEAEEKEGAKTDGVFTRKRSLSVSDGTLPLPEPEKPIGKLKMPEGLFGGATLKPKPPPPPPKPQLHPYRGQTGAEKEYSSAFVFGHRQKDETWKFYAQFTRGVTTHAAKTILTENVAVLYWADKPLYEI